MVVAAEGVERPGTVAVLSAITDRCSNEFCEFECIGTVDGDIFALDLLVVVVEGFFLSVGMEFTLLRFDGGGVMPGVFLLISRLP